MLFRSYVGGKITSYYGFNYNTNSKTTLATTDDIAVANLLGSAASVSSMSADGQTKSIQATNSITVNSNSNYTNSNITGVINTVSGSITGYTGETSDSSIKYDTFKLKLVP